jgi:hypothetical protein
MGIVKYNNILYDEKYFLHENLGITKIMFLLKIYISPFIRYAFYQEITCERRNPDKPYILHYTSKAILTAAIFKRSRNGQLKMYCKWIPICKGLC